MGREGGLRGVDKMEREVGKMPVRGRKSVWLRGEVDGDVSAEEGVV